MSDKTTEQRFWEKVDKSGDCWEWTGAKNDSGYGFIRNGDMERAHRFSYELAKGEIPANMHVLHSCDNPGCVNPKHLSIGTHQDNVQDMMDKQRGNRHHGNHVKGEEVHTAKLTESDIREIRKMNIKRGDITSLAIRYGVSPKNMSRIIHDEIWKDVK